MGRKENPLKVLFYQRLYFFIEVLIVFFGIFLFLLITIPYTLVLDPSSNPSFSIIYGPIYYVLKAIFAILGIALFLYVANFAVGGKRRKIVLDIDISSTQTFLNLFKIKKANYKYQILYGLILLFLVFIPLDFFTYLLVPEMLEFTADSLLISDFNNYLSEPYFGFLISVIIIQVSVAVFEESISRGLLANRGSTYVQKMSAVIISSFYFGLGHFAYILSPAAAGVPASFPLIWFIEAIVIGIILGMFVIRKRWIFPVIFAHALNNIISAHAVWNHIQGNDFSTTFYFYIPLLIVGVALLIWQFSRVKDGVIIGFKDFGKYFKNEKEIGETTYHKVVRIMLDLLVGLILFAIGLILTA